MTIALEQVSIPAWSTIGYGVGRDEHRNVVRFAGDHRPLRQLGEALATADEPLLVEVEPWQIIDHAAGPEEDPCSS